MDVFYAYNLGTSGWLATQALPLLFSPRVIVSLLSPEPRNATDIETYFARVLAFSLLTLSVFSLQLTGVIPSTATGDSDTAYVLPTLIITTAYHTLTGVYQYLYCSQGGTASVGLGALANGALAATGVWCMLFATDKGHISKRTGADKRTSSLWFRNDVAEERKRGKKRL